MKTKKVTPTNKQPTKAQKNLKANTKQAKSIPDTLKEVENFLKIEIDKQGQIEVINQEILYLKEDQLISSSKSDFMALSSEEIVFLKRMIRDIVSEELDNRGLTSKI